MDPRELAVRIGIWLRPYVLPTFLGRVLVARIRTPVLFPPHRLASLAAAPPQLIEVHREDQHYSDRYLLPERLYLPDYEAVL